MCVSVCVFSYDHNLISYYIPKFLGAGDGEMTTGKNVILNDPSFLCVCQCVYSAMIIT